MNASGDRDCILQLTYISAGSKHIIIVVVAVIPSLFRLGVVTATVHRIAVVIVSSSFSSSAINELPLWPFSISSIAFALSGVVGAR